MKAETKFDMAGVLVLHGGGLPDPRTAEPTCYCGWRGVAFSRSSTWLEQHAEHQADAISAHIAETLGSSEAREAVAVVLWESALSKTTDPEVLEAMGWESGLPEFFRDRKRDQADAALAAVGDLLGVEVGR